MLRLHGSTGKLDQGLKQTGLATGRLGNQFASLAGHIAGVHPIVGNLAGVLGNFAIGAGLTVGVLAGVAAVAVVYDKLTESTRKAKEEQDKLIASLERTLYLKGLGPGGATVEEVGAAQARADALKTQITNMEALIVKDAQDADVMQSNLQIQEKINKLYIERQNILNTLAGGQSVVNEKVNAAIRADAEEKARKAKEAAEKLAAAMKKAAEFAAKYAMYMYEAGQWTANISGVTLAGLTLQDAEKRLGLDRGQFKMAVPEGEVPGIAMPFENLDKRQKDQLRALGVLTDKADENAKLIQGAVVSSANVIANTLLSAVNVGGGGRGSQIGGMLGGGLGSTWGSTMGWAGGPIGAVIGGLGGSFLGGLFDKPESRESVWQKQLDEQKAHTAWLKANNQLLGDIAGALIYAPSGFRAERYRYNASDPRPWDAAGRSLRWNASRGGANPLLGT